jgi:hypothetical protein
MVGWGLTCGCTKWTWLQKCESYLPLEYGLWTRGEEGEGRGRRREGKGEKEREMERGEGRGRGRGSERERRTGSSLGWRGGERGKGEGRGRRREGKGEKERAYVA